MKIIRADAMGICSGVRDALQLTDRIDNPESVTIHGELVHNEIVLVQLEARGFGVAAEQGRSKLPETIDVLITAHGISNAERKRLESAGKRLIDTTCPLVRRVHRSAQALDGGGYHVLVIGRSGHVEVQGLIEDLHSYDVIETPADVRRYFHNRLGVICQTTTPPRVAEQIRAAIRVHNRHAEIRFVDTICQPTRDRQQAVERLLWKIDVMVAVGGRNSNNTRQLVHRCREQGKPCFHIQSAADINPEWFHGLHAVGLTAGMSTLDSTIDEVYDALCKLDTDLEFKSTSKSETTGHSALQGPYLQSLHRGPKSSREWCAHFRHNSELQFDIPWNEGVHLTEAERATVAKSIQQFQLGESGQGRHLIRVAGDYAARSGDQDYVEAVKLFIKEEQRHAAYLGRFLDVAGIQQIRREWSNGFFRWLVDVHSAKQWRAQIREFGKTPAWTGSRR